MASTFRDYLSPHGLTVLAEEVNFGRKKAWSGKQDEWNALTADERDKYEVANIITPMNEKYVIA